MCKRMAEWTFICSALTLAYYSLADCSGCIKIKNENILNTNDRLWKAKETVSIYQLGDGNTKKYK